MCVSVCGKVSEEDEHWENIAFSVGYTNKACVLDRWSVYWKREDVLCVFVRLSHNEAAPRWRRLMFFPEGLLGKEQRRRHMTLFALDSLWAQRRNITSAGDDGNKDGLMMVTEVCVFASRLKHPSSFFLFLKSASEQKPTHFFHRVQSTSSPRCHSCRDVSAGYIATRRTVNVTRPKLAGQISSGNNHISLESHSVKGETIGKEKRNGAICHEKEL